jgi:alpha-ketoglutarate-dependent taurine dioxygenase
MCPTTLASLPGELVRTACAAAASDGVPLHDRRAQLALARALARLDVVVAAIREVREALRADGHALVAVPGLAAMPRPERDRAVVAVSCLLGTPSPVDLDEQILVWDVRARLDLPEQQRALNVSVSAGQACLHTDSTFASRPERWFGLWCLRPAADGGANVLVDGRRLLDSLAADPAARHVRHVLREQNVPLWDGRRLVPTRVLGRDQHGHLTVRYREDLIERGVHLARLAPDDPVVLALRAFADLLGEPEHRRAVRLDRDEVLFVDNHRMLHAREHFADARRHLLRTRMHEPPLVRLDERAE